MGRVNKITSNEELPPLRPAFTPEAREAQMISLAMDLVEKRLRNGTATSQETTHFLKLATVNAQNDRRIQELQMELLEAKTSAIKSSEVQEQLYANAIDAMRRYSGNYTEEEEMFNG